MSVMGTKSGTALASPPGRPRPEIHDDAVREAIRHVASNLEAQRSRLRSRAPKSALKLGDLTGPPLREASHRYPQRLLSRATFGWSLIAAQEVDELRPQAWIDRQLEPDSIDDFGLEDLIAEALPTTAMTPFQIIVTYGDQFEIPYIELIAAVTIRALYSTRQLFERTVAMWSEHFHTSLNSDFSPLLKPSEDREVTRAHALGKFEELLRASAHSPAMLSYLTNDTNVAGHANENYARELMELHTLGTDGAYDEGDVREVARCLTGWTFDKETVQFGQYRFVAADHDQGGKLVLGAEIAAGGGQEDGERVIDLLAGHPQTAEFVSTKILEFFWGYTPPAHTVRRLTEVWDRTDGDIRELLRTALVWYEQAQATPKLKRPFHHIVSAARATFAEIDFELLLFTLYEGGHLPFTWGPPNGFPDAIGYWSGLLLPRFNAANRFGHPAIDAVNVHPAFLEATSPEHAVEIARLLIHGGSWPETEVAAVRRFLQATNTGPARVRQAMGLALASPSFQYY